MPPAPDPPFGPPWMSATMLAFARDPRSPTRTRTAALDALHAFELEPDVLALLPQLDWRDRQVELAALRLLLAHREPVGWDRCAEVLARLPEDARRASALRGLERADTEHTPVAVFIAQIESIVGPELAPAEVLRFVDVAARLLRDPALRREHPRYAAVVCAQGRRELLHWLLGLIAPEVRDVALFGCGLGYASEFWALDDWAYRAVERVEVLREADAFDDAEAAVLVRSADGLRAVLQIADADARNAAMAQWTKRTRADMDALGLSALLRAWRAQ